MTFQSLLVSKDAQASDVLTPVLAGFGLGVQCCGYPDALCRLTEQKFDAVIVDYDDPHSAALVLQNAFQSSTPHKTVTVALLGDKTKVRHVFGAGANVVLYKPISQQQAESSLRAAMALMKRERRRSFRVPVQLPVRLRVENGAEMEGILLDLSEDGLDVLAAQPLCPAAIISAHFVLPDQDQAEGMVRVMHPEFGMGIEFASGTAEQREHVGTFINFLTSRPGTLPQLLITPRALAALNEQDYRQTKAADEPEDLLLGLLSRSDSLSQEDFLKELRQQRSSEKVAF